MTGPSAITGFSSRAQNTGAVLMIRYSLIRLAFTQIATGHWASAPAGVDTAIELARRTGEPALAASQELRASGESTRRREPSGVTQLTHAELQVAHAP